MNKNAIAINLLLCAALGGLISYFSSILWLTASLWVFAALFINGSIAFHEDAQPSGFNNPDGTAAPEFANGGALSNSWPFQFLCHLWPSSWVYFSRFTFRIHLQP